MTNREVMQQALEALIDAANVLSAPMFADAADALRTALAQPEQEPVIDGNTSDGYHTFNELYEFRKAYNIALFNEWAANGKCFVHKSWRHNDGELCFGGGWFIVVAVLPQGQISNHYEAKDWDLFHIQETEKALFEFDGHTGADVIERLKSYTTPPQRKEPEPVVWMYQDKSTHEVRFQKHMRGFVDHGATYETPLYTTPPPCPTCEALARTVMMGQKGKDV